MENPVVLMKMLQKFSMRIAAAKSNQRSRSSQQTSGFTLIEVLVVVLIIGILASIVGPGWLAFLNRQRINKANDVVLSALQEAQREAKKTKYSYSVSFKNENNVPMYAVHRDSTVPAADDIRWKNLGTDLGLKPGQVLMGTNVTANNAAGPSVSYTALNTAPQTITFDYMGTLPPDPKPVLDAGNDGNNEGLIIALSVPKVGDPTQPTGVKRCVMVKTLLGSVITGKQSQCE